MRSATSSRNIVDAAVLSLRIRQNEASGSRASSVAAMDSTGVIPLPPTTAANCPGRGVSTKRPIGGIASTWSPTASSFSA